jgi:membrane-anchored protein YejM (alkaline phosphatase superfamily)
MPPSPPRRFLLRWCGWFFLGTGLLFALLALRYLRVAPIADGFAPRAFRASMFVTQAALLVFVLLLVTAPVVMLVPRKRVVVPLAVVLATGVLVVVLVDTFVYQQYRFHLDASVWRLLTDGGAETTFHMPASTHVAFAGIVLGFGAVMAMWALASWKLTQRVSGRRIGLGVMAVLAVVLVTHNGVHTWANAAGYAPITQQVGVLPLHKPVTAKHLMRKLGIEVAQSKLPAGSIASGLLYPREPLAFTPPAVRENVCLMVVDSWRADALTPRATPNLARLAEESVRFEEHHSGGNATRMGMFSLFYGLPGTYWADILAERRACVLVQEFQKQGYEIAVFRSAPIYSPEFDQTIFSGVNGLRRESKGDGPAACDRDLTDDFIAWLGARDSSRPFFALVFYDAPHAYDVPPDFPREFEPSWKNVDYLALDGDTDPKPFENLYLNAVRWSDHQAGRAIDALRERGVIDQTCLVVTGDHGQEFNDLGLSYWGHNSNFAQYQTHVPLFVRRAGLAPGTRAHLTSHFDVASTLLSDVLGCTNPPADYCVGRNLFDDADRGVLTISAYSRYAAVRPGRRFLVVEASGQIDVLGADYRPREWEDGDSEYLRESFRQRARFRPGGVLDP